MKRTVLTATVALFLSFLLLVSFVPFSKADFEAPQIQWDETYGPLEGYSVVQTFDGGYVIAGQQADFREFQPHLLSGWENYTAWLIKVDASGNAKWNRTYDNEVGGGLCAYSVIQTTDSGYALIGLQQKLASNQVVFIIKTDSNGDIQWNTTVVWSESTKLCEGIQTTDGCYILAGVTRGDGPDNSSWILKTDEQGNILWSRTFEGSTNRVFAVAEANDGGCVMAGNWENDCWFVKLDVNGNVQWNQTYDFRYPDEPWNTYCVTSIVENSDGGYVLGGGNTHRAFLVKTNSEGLLEWNRFYEDDSAFNSIVQATDGDGYFAVGGCNDGVWFVRFGSSGDLLWNSTYNITRGDSEHRNDVKAIVKTSDGGYAVVGALDSEVWLVKFAPDYVAPPDGNNLPDSSDDLPEDNSMFTQAWFVTTTISAAIIVASVVIYFKKLKRQH